MEQIIRNFALDGNVVSHKAFGSGHINKTYLLHTDKGHDYILQKINHHIFKETEKLMENIFAVTEYLAKMEKDPRRVMHFVRTQDGKGYCRDEEGGYWRVCEFVQDSLSLDMAETPEDFYESAVGFGQFQMQLRDFPAETLHETIPHFHDTPVRFETFRRAIEKDVCGRLESVKAEVEFALAREEEAGCMMRLLSEGKLPLRVTHNDTKLNNVLLDRETRKSLCVLDLDTVMPGLIGHDFGDAIRSYTNTGAEDDKNLDNVEMSLEMFKAYAEGYLHEQKASMVQSELDWLAFSARYITFEQVLRFLMDYIDGDKYYKTAYPEHNLVRTHAQYKLLQSMERQYDAMCEIIKNI